MCIHIYICTMYYHDQCTIMINNTLIAIGNPHIMIMFIHINTVIHYSSSYIRRYPKIVATTMENPIYKWMIWGYLHFNFTTAKSPFQGQTKAGCKGSPASVAPVKRICCTSDPKSWEKNGNIMGTLG